MLLKALLAALALLAGGFSVLRASVLLESYLLLVGGVLLSLAAVLLVARATDPDTPAARSGRSARSTRA